jgi:hypothetical protein
MGPAIGVPSEWFLSNANSAGSFREFRAAIENVRSWRTQHPTQAQDPRKTYRARKVRMVNQRSARPL